MALGDRRRHVVQPLSMPPVLPFYWPRLLKENAVDEREHSCAIGEQSALSTRYPPRLSPHLGSIVSSGGHRCACTLRGGFARTGVHEDHSKDHPERQQLQPRKH